MTLPNSIAPLSAQCAAISAYRCARRKGRSCSNIDTPVTTAFARSLAKGRFSSLTPTIPGNFAAMTFALDRFDLDTFVAATLAEDLGTGGDITSAAVIPADARLSGLMDSRAAIGRASCGERVCQYV